MHTATSCKEEWTKAFDEWNGPKPKNAGYLGVSGREWLKNREKNLKVWLAACEAMKD